MEYFISVTAQASSESLAPYMLGSWNEGRYVEGSGIWQEAGIKKPLNTKKRFSWGAGVEYLAGIGSKTGYQRWSEESETWSTNNVRRSGFRLTQLYGEVKYRAAYFTVGMKSSKSLIVDEDLSSGDLTRSNNAAPLPMIAAGFIDFQDIPFLKGWVQIDGELIYGKFVDNGFKKSEFNYYSGVEALNLWYNYKKCYFRTNPSKRFHVIVGMQAAAVFGGSAYTYRMGKLAEIDHRGFKLKDAFHMFLPIEGGEDYYTGNHVGSWDLKATYRFNNDSRLKAYFEWPWEDGSGIGKMNGWDGLWGLQYDFSKNGIVSKVAFEYLDFTNQAGPLHFDPEDNPDNPLTGHAQGADSYYNNDYYGSYTNYGMSIGSPFLLSPIYNRNGMLNYLHNRARGFHAALEGNPTSRISYRLMCGYEIAGGYGWVPSMRMSHSSSGMLEVRMLPMAKNPELEIGLRLAFDNGSLRGNNFGTQLQISYRGELKFKKR